MYSNHYLVKIQVHSTYSHFAEMEIMTLYICVACCLEPSSKFLVPFALHSIPKRQAGLAVGWWYDPLFTDEMKSWWYDPLFIDEMKSPAALWEQFVWRPCLESHFGIRSLSPEAVGTEAHFRALSSIPGTLKWPSPRCKPQGLRNDENFGHR